MPKITEELIRKRAEHNECIISTLEEISLHQQDIERIEYIDKWCRELKILYLQSNLIPRIENVGRLKKLEYINLALNNIELIENLEGCESLKKLDLTINFVGELTSIETLKDNYNLRDLYLTGNPCAEYEDYRDYVIATLPQLQTLDGRDIEKSERIRAVQTLPVVRDGILEQQKLYRKKRQKQKEEHNAKQEGKTKKDGSDWYTDTSNTKHSEADDVSTSEHKEKTADEVEKEFWEEKTDFTPESRLEVHHHMEEKRRREKPDNTDPNHAKKDRPLQTNDGRRLNVNEAKIDFTLKDDLDGGVFELDVAVYKYLDTSLCDVDVQTDYVVVTIKGKVLQLVLPEEVKPDSSTAKRSQTTGHLLITMPKANHVLKAAKSKEKVRTRGDKEKKSPNSTSTSIQKLEVDSSCMKTVDLGNIVKEASHTTQEPLSTRTRQVVQERPNSEKFVDDPDVPPLM